MSESVHESVKAAVLEWARAQNLEASAKALGRAKRRLAPELHTSLRSEVALISAKTFVDLLAMDARPEPGEEPVEVDGQPMYRRQAERLSAWRYDQTITAKAIGISPEQWARMIRRAMERELERTDKPESAPTPRRPRNNPFAQELDWASDFAKNAPRADRSEPPKTSGVTGLIGARTFGKQ